MSTDNYSLVLYNDGEEITFQDLINNQSKIFSRVMDQLVSGGGPAWNSSDSEFLSQFGAPLGELQLGPYAYALNVGGACLRQGSANNKVALSAGTLLQKVGTSDGVTTKLLPFTFAGGDIATIANGDPVNPRVDIIQMALSFVDDTPVTVNTLTTPIKSSLNLATVTTHINTVVRAIVPGASGNNISIALTPRSSGTGVTYSENGNAITILYQSGVSTVLDIEAAIIASSTLIEIQSAGTPGNIATSPADTFTTTHLNSGLNAVILPTPLNKSRRIQAVITVKQGTPAASPAYPLPDAGNVIIAGVVVGTNYSGGSGFKFNDSAGAVAVLHDQRMPIRIRPYMTYCTEFIFPDSSFPSDFTFANRIYLQRSAVSGAANVWMPLLSGPGTGRLVQAEVAMADPVTMNSRLARFNSVTGADVELSGANMNGTGSGQLSLRHTTPLQFQQLHLPAAGPTVTANVNGVGAPIWSSGYRGPVEVWFGGISGATGFPTESEFLTLKYVNPAALSRFSFARFYIAGSF